MTVVICVVSGFEVYTMVPVSFLFFPADHGDTLQPIRILNLLVKREEISYLLEGFIGLV